MSVVAGARKVRDGLVLSFDAQNKKSLNMGNNLINPGTWAVGTGSVTGFSINGTAEENHRVLGTDPFGNTNVVVWEARPEGISGSDGGWNGSYFTIDNTKMYRFSVWVKRNSNADGRFYLGLNASGTSNLLLTRTNIASTTTNPYFWSSITGFIVDEWELVVGHVWPAGTQTGSIHSDSGRYRIGSGRVANISSDFVWHEGNTSARHRSYLYYSTNTEQRQQFVYPRVDLVDGTEPSIDDLLNNRVGVLNDASGSENHGTLINSPAYSGNSVIFDNLDNYVLLPNDIGYTTQVSVFTWFKSNGTPEGNYHIIFGGVQLELSVPTSGQIRTGVQTSTRYVSNHGSGLMDGNWHYIGFTFDGSIKESYIDGVSVGTQVVAGSLVYSFTNRTIGRFGSSTGYYLNGEISAATIYNRPLSSEEVRKNFLASKSRFGL